MTESATQSAAHPPKTAFAAVFKVYGHRFLIWLMDEKQWRWARALGRMIKKVFTKHPAETRETYLQHLWFTTKTSLRFVFISLLLFIHGLLPFTFTRTASKQIERIYLIMRSRIPQARREAIEIEYDI